jgi:diguanylate cyclase (GGDEF)-like protein/PAS domain S-box-containing protein/putative nucleotidyltransferase with HDIG domain
LVQLTVFVAVVSVVVYFYYLRKMLEHLDPSKVVPDRVRAALDTLASGLVVLDQDERIVLANAAFANTIGRESSKLQGMRVSELPWQVDEDTEESEASRAYPWRHTLEDGVSENAVTVGLTSDDAEKRTFMVNTTPITGDDGKSRGVLASFDDVTLLEKKQRELEGMLEQLQESSEEIRNQNQQLQVLATQDPLTGCLNRRSFFEKFDSLWSAASRYDQPLSCLMLDIDHFKSVNDEHGHATGDVVLQKTAGILKTAARDCDLVCRYGGEEFAVVLPHTDIDEAYQAAERFRRTIESTEFEDLSITVSIGVSAIGLGAATPQIMLDQADKCLYVAKRNGRNQAIRWDEVPDDVEVDESQATRADAVVETNDSVPVPYHAVTALISALAYRDQATAEHSRRVADYCVTTAEGLMSAREVYLLEMGALLHDIGKIGVPDSILLKPGPLTEEEWEVMETHDHMAVEIIRASFNSPELTAIVENHHAFYGDGSRHPDLPTGEDIPVGARILSICDAYDAIISDRVYRKGRSQDEAFAELRRCAGTQFDPELVERFIRNLTARQQQEPVETGAVTKETALSIGLQIERLSAALDDRDLSSLKVMAKRLNTTAARQGVYEIAAQAAQLDQSLTGDEDLLEVVIAANDLLDLCRSTQRSYLTDSAANSTEEGTMEP